MQTGVFMTLLAFLSVNPSVMVMHHYINMLRCMHAYYN